MEPPDKMIHAERVTFPSQRKMRQRPIDGVELQGRIGSRKQFGFTPSGGGYTVVGVPGTRNPAVMHGLRQLTERDFFQRAGAAIGWRIDRKVCGPLPAVPPAKNLSAQIVKLHASL